MRLALIVIKKKKPDRYYKNNNKRKLQVDIPNEYKQKNPNKIRSSGEKKG